MRLTKSRGVFRMIIVGLPLQYLQFLLSAVVLLVDSRLTGELRRPVGGRLVLPSVRKQPHVALSDDASHPRTVGPDQHLQLVVQGDWLRDMR